MKRHTFHTAGAVFLLAALLCAPATADGGEVATANVTGGSLYWNVHVGYDGLKLTVSGEDRYVARTFESGDTPSFSLFDDEGEPLPDGTYKWELVVLPKLTELDPEEFENLRSSVDGADVRAARAPERQAASGTFTVRGGQVVNPDLSEGSTDRPAEQGNTLATKDFVINDDLIVIGSQCLGFDCANGEVFSFDTLRLKENNTRIKFEDTSTAGSFPTNDWQLTANDSASGGLNKFSIDDISGGRTPFTIEASAPSHSLYVDDSGRIGLGTSTPVVEIHVKDGDSPTLRLEQDGSSGFSPQVFDVAGNEANFFVRDSTNGSTLPFRIRPGAPTSSIDIAASGNVGIGTQAPSGNLHVKDGSTEVLFADTTGVGIGTASPGAALDIEEAGGGAAVTFLRLTNTNGPARLQFRDDTNSVNWDFRTTSGDTFVITQPTSPSNDLLLNSSGDLVIRGGLTEGSSRAIKEEFSSIDSQDVLERVNSLPITSWAYTGDAARHIGPMAEDFYATFGLGIDDKHISPSDKAGVALVAIQGLSDLAEEKDREIESLRHQIEELKLLVDELTKTADGR